MTSPTKLSDLPPDIKDLISKKISPREMIILKSTTKDLNDALKDSKVLFSDKDYFKYVIKPYTNRLLSNIKSYNKENNKNISITKFMKSKFLNEKDIKIKTGSKVMRKDPGIYIPKIKESIQNGLKTSTFLYEKDIYKRYEVKSFKEIDNLNDLKQNIKRTVHNIMIDKYWEADPIRSKLNVNKERTIRWDM
jgi:hypothetical protein